MKTKRLLLLSLLPVLTVLAIAGKSPSASPPPPQPLPKGSVDIDLTTMNRTMLYSQVFEMVSNPQRYQGKTLRMKGAYATSVGRQDPAKRYHACLISDAMACCAQGIEFVATNVVAYPADYPAPGQLITVQGVFDTYEEDGERYPHVRDAFLTFRRLPKTAK